MRRGWIIAFGLVASCRCGSQDAGERPRVDAHVDATATRRDAAADADVTDAIDDAIVDAPSAALPPSSTGKGRPPKRLALGPRGGCVKGDRWRCWTWAPFPVAEEQKLNGIGDAIEIAVGDGYACAVRADARVACWGANLQGQLGDGTSDDRASPVVISVTNATRIAAAESRTCALTSDGDVWCWGSMLGENLFLPQLQASMPNPTTPQRALAPHTVDVAVASGRYCGLVDDGTIRCAGPETRQRPLPDEGEKLDPAPTAVASMLAVTSSITCVLGDDHVAYCQGAAEYGELGNGTSLATSRGTDAGAVHEIGHFVPALRGVVSVTGIAQTLLAIDARRTVVAQGQQLMGLLGPNASDAGESLVAISIEAAGEAVELATDGNNVACALRGDGSVWCWGSGAAVPRAIEWKGRAAGP
jgi:alpha-tubulin suppressor-like RCC1 family protein